MHILDEVREKWEIYACFILYFLLNKQTGGASNVLVFGVEQMIKIMMVSSKCTGSNRHTIRRQGTPKVGKNIWISSKHASCYPHPHGLWCQLQHFLSVDGKATTENKSKLRNAKFFTQTATVSHEALGLQRSRLTGSSSQTKSEEEAVKYTVQMTSCCSISERIQHID